MSTRTTAVWVPDWPVVAAATAADIPAHLPVAVQDARAVVAVGAVARRSGVRRGMRRRQAQEACPGLVLLPVDELRDARFFEPVAVAVERVVAGLEVARPGLLLMPASGAAQFHGSEEDLAAAIVTHVADATGHECQVGVADGILAAVLAARESRVVPAGESSAYLAPRSLGDVVHVAMSRDRVTQVRDLVDLWNRLGLRRAKDLTALDLADVASRFGEPGVWAHRLLDGDDLRPPARRRPEDDVEASCELDPPAHRVDTAAFAARRLAEQLYADLVDRSASCTRLRISARTEDGREHVRTWRTDAAALGGLTVGRLTDRVRWQLEGWLAEGGRTESADGGLVRLVLTAEDLVDVGTQQGGLWGGAEGAHLRAARALERVQGLLGARSVLSVRLQGGRGPRDQVHLVPWGEEDPVRRDTTPPWPGRLPDPPPSEVLPEKAPVRLLGPAREPVLVDRRLMMSAAPTVLAPPPGEDGTAAAVRAWAGPWPLAQRWWREDAERSVYLQVLVEEPAGTSRALLLSSSRGSWYVEASYD